MPNKRTKPGSSRLTKSTSVTLAVELIEPALKRAAELGFEHSFSGYLVFLLKRDLKKADAEARALAGVDQLIQDAKEIAAAQKRKPPTDE